MNAELWLDRARPFMQVMPLKGIRMNAELWEYQARAFVQVMPMRELE